LTNIWRTGYPQFREALSTYLSLAVCVPLGTLCGALYAFESNAVQGMIDGSFMDLVMGFGGVERVTAFVCGPKEFEE
jgi:hypothetical protein